MEIIFLDEGEQLHNYISHIDELFKLYYDKILTY
jgi:hypothetical protein